MLGEGGAAEQQAAEPHQRAAAERRAAHARDAEALREQHGGAGAEAHEQVRLRDVGPLRREQPPHAGAPGRELGHAHALGVEAAGQLARARAGEAEPPGPELRHALGHRARAPWPGSARGGAPRPPAGRASPGSRPHPRPPPPARSRPLPSFSSRSCARFRRLRSTPSWLETRRPDVYRVLRTPRKAFLAQPRSALPVPLGLAPGGARAPALRHRAGRGLHRHHR